jgi:hypothetical protein
MGAAGPTLAVAARSAVAASTAGLTIAAAPPRPSVDLDIDAGQKSAHLQDKHPALATFSAIGPFDSS